MTRKTGFDPSRKKRSDTNGKFRSFERLSSKEGSAPAPRARKINFYNPKKFKGAQSREEEDRLAEGTVNRIALEVLNAFEETEARMDTLLKNHIHDNQKLLTSREKANLSKTVANVIRWKSRIDYLVSKVLKMNAEQLDTTLKNAHRLAVWNTAFMNKSVEKSISLSDFSIPKSHGIHKESLRQFIKFLNKAKKDIPLPNPKKNALNAFSIIYAHPAWLLEKLISWYGEENTKKICDFNNAEPPLTVRINTLKGAQSEILKHIESEKFTAKKCRFAANGFFVEGKNEIFSTAAFGNGEFEIQDESSQLFAEWCDPKPSDILIDACAGSGGKSIFFSALMKNRGKIMATDPNEGSLEQLKKRAVRAGCTNIEILSNPDEYLSKADKVIIDAPCSGLGVLARNPDIKWRLKEENILRLVEEQKNILAQNCKFVRPGGELIYGTCTLNPDENENVIRDFLSGHTEFDAVTAHHEKFRPFTDKEGFFNLRPHQHGLSGFFGCKMIRKQ
jgi:16S rRNA (cytosine967-C5)-methyltransferase